MNVLARCLLIEDSSSTRLNPLSVTPRRRRTDSTTGERVGGIQILPALTKIDMPAARPLEVALAVSDLLGFDPDCILETSARTRIGITELLDTICKRIPPPERLADDADGSPVLRAKVIDSWFETKRGVIALVRVLSGSLLEGDRISIVEPASYEQVANGDGDAHKVGKDSFSVQESKLLLTLHECRMILTPL